MKRAIQNTLWKADLDSGRIDELAEEYIYRFVQEEMDEAD